MLVHGGRTYVCMHAHIHTGAYAYIICTFTHEYTLAGATLRDLAH